MDARGVLTLERIARIQIDGSDRQQRNADLVYASGNRTPLTLQDRFAIGGRYTVRGFALDPKWCPFAFGKYRDLVFLGVFLRGVVGIGTLARTPKGGYVQVKGYVVDALSLRREG